MKALSILILAVACLGHAAPASAQTAPGAEPGVTREDCRAAPESGNDPAGQSPGTDLAAKLDRCNGVLQPPPTGDAEIREPAPDGGKTPVIPPGALPQQPPADGDAPS